MPSGPDDNPPEETDEELRGAFSELGTAAADYVGSPEGAEDLGAEESPEQVEARGDKAPRGDGEEAAEQRPKGDEPEGAEPAAQAAESQIPAEEPFTYQAIGKLQTLEGATVIPGHGAIIDADALPKLQQRLAEGEYFRQRAEQAQHRSAELDRYVTVQTPQGQTLKGREAVAQLQVQNAVNSAFAKYLFQQFEPERLATLATDPNQLALFKRELEIIGREAEFGVRNSMGPWANARDEGAADHSTITHSAISNAVQFVANQAFPAVPQEQRAAFAAHLGRFSDSIIRAPRNAQEKLIADQDPVLPGKVVDLQAIQDAFGEWMQGRRAPNGAQRAANAFNAPLLANRPAVPGKTPPNKPPLRDKPKEPETYSDARRDFRRTLRDALHGV